MATSLRYFGTVRLKHKGTGLYLCASAETYKQEWSTDQHAVLLKPASDDPDLDWIIRPPCGMDFIKSVGDEVIIPKDSTRSPSSVLRFYSQTRQKHLHSHGDRPAPWFPRDDSKHEVTLFSNPPFGDTNDNWQVQRAPFGNEPPEDEVTIQHFMTDWYLASDERPPTDLKSGASAKVVWTIEEALPEDCWILEPQPELVPVFEPDIVARYESRGRKVVLRTLPEAEQWIGNLRSAYEPFLQRSPTVPFFPVAQEILNCINRLHQCVVALQDIDSIDGYESIVADFRHAALEIFSSGTLLDPNTSDFQFAASLFKASPGEAWAVFMRLTGREIREASGSVVTGLIKLEMFQRFGAGLPEQSWQTPLQEIESARRALGDTTAAAKDELVTVVKQAQDLFERSKGNQERLAQDMTSALERIRDSFRSEKISDAPGHYWRLKRNRHQFWIKVLSSAFAVSILLLGGALGGIFYRLRHAHAELSASEFLAHFALPIAAITSLIIWGMKALSRNLISQIHLEADAHERETMLLTFRALLQDTSKPLGEEEKKIIVSIAFRPGGNGLGDESSGPTWIWENWIKSDK